MVALKDLKNNRASILSEIQKKLEGSKTNNSRSKERDERFWNVTRDDSGAGAAIIRFLPGTSNDPFWVTIYEHAFQGPGGWYIEKNLSTIGKKDPVYEVNKKLWDSGLEANKEIARKQKRKVSYYSNILVIKDPKCPENEGKVFLFKYGTKLHQKILASMYPEDDGLDKATPVVPFDPWTGANFRLKVKIVSDYPNYDDSTFESPSALFDGDDAKIEAICSQQHSLNELIDEKHFKTYEELEARLNRVLQIGVETGRQARPVNNNKNKTVETVDSDEVVDNDIAEAIDAEVSSAFDDDLSYLQSLAGK